MALTASNLAMLFVGGAMFSMWFFVSLYLQDVLRFSPLITGVGFLPQTAAHRHRRPDQLAAGDRVTGRAFPCWSESS